MQGIVKAYIFEQYLNPNKMNAQSLINQLGGNKFIVMTGAKNFVAGESVLMFNIGRGAKSGINKIRIELKNDLYNVFFYNMRKAQYQVSQFENVYAENLTSLFTKETGFVTSF